MKNKKTYFMRIISALMVFVMLAVLPPAANANPLDDLNQKLKEQYEEYFALESERNAIQVRLNTSQSQVNATQRDINSMIAAIKAKEEEIAIMQDILQQKMDELAETEALFMQRMRAMYMMQDGSVLGTLLGASSLEEWLAAEDNLQRVSDEDMELLSLLEEQRLEIERQKAELDAQLAELEAQKKALEQKKAQYLRQLATVQGEEAANKQEMEMTWADIEATIAQKKLIEADFVGSSEDYVGGTFLWPVPGYGHISSPYGYRTWSNGYVEWHNGIDIAKGSQASIQGALIVASNSGRVITARYNAGGYGYYVIIDHGGNNYTVYGHCSALLVSPGQVVLQGDPIARVGSTGNSTGPHLHFEIRLNGQNVDPYPLVAGSRPASR